MGAKILISGPRLASEAMALLEEKQATVITAEPYSSSEFISDLAAKEEIDALIVRMGKITADVLAASPRLKVVTKHGVGVDNIDVEAATKLGIPVMITPNANQQSVAEHTVGLMFALAKKTVLLDKRLRQGHWDKAVYNGTELRGKCLCLIGFGRIGRRVAELVKPLEMEVMVFDPYLPEEVEVPGVKIVSNLTELLKVADFVSIHCPCTDETRNLIGIEHFKIMKRTAYIINTARGELIQQDALVYALEQGLIAGAGIDTFAVEPATKNNPLWAFENVVVTPHIAGATKEALRNMGCSAVNNIFRVLEGAEIDPATVINPSVLEVK